MPIKIGTQGLSLTGQSVGYGTRRQYEGPRVAPSQNTSGLAVLAGAVAGLGDVGANYYAQREQEDKQKQGFDALTKWNTFEGTFNQRIEAAKTSAPADGSGYTNTVAKEFEAGWKELQKEIPPDLLPEFRARAEDLRQRSILGSDGWTREQTGKHSGLVIEKAVDDAKARVYENPGAPVEDGIAEIISAAPGLTSQEKEVLANEALKQVHGANFGGVVRKGRENQFVIPYSKEVNRKLIPLIVGAESSGNPSAESPAGAQGLMQVMPSTAVEIAQDLHDPNFPYEKGPEAWKSYLKSPGVNTVYGTFYINQLLKQFGGDMELALIGYNAGPGNAEKFRDSGRDWNALPKAEETKPYVEKIMKGMGALTPDMIFDPKYGLDYEQMVQGGNLVENEIAKAQADADSRVKAGQQAAARAQEAAMQVLDARAEAGEDFRPIYLDAIAKGEVAYDRSAMTAGIEISNRVRKDKIVTEQAVQKYTLGEAMSGVEGDRVITPDLRAGMLAQDENAIGQVVARSAKMGFVPPATQKDLESMLYSPDLNVVSAGAQIITALRQANPGITRNMPDEMVARAVSMNALREIGTPSDQLRTYMEQTRSPESRAMLAQAKKNDDTYTDNKIPTAATIANTFATLNGWVPGGPSAPTVGMTTLFQTQYGEVYDMYFAQTLNSTLAKTLALQHVARTWGVTETGGQKQVSWLPPEIALTTFRQDLNGDGQKELIQQTPEQARASFNREVFQRYGITNFQVFATPDTKTALDRGEPVPYGIFPVDADGNPSYDTEVLRELATGDPFEYDYRAVQLNNAALLDSRVIQKNKLRAAQDAGPTPGETDAAYQARLQDLQISIGEINKELGQ